MKNLRKQIKEVLAGLPEREFSYGLYATKIGTKWVHFINTFGTTTKDKISLDDFRIEYLA